MAYTITTLEPISGARKFDDGINANVPISVKAAAGVLHSITIDNSANAAASFTKLFDLLFGSITMGTTAPDWQYKVPAGAKITFPVIGGVAFAVGLCCATVTSKDVTGVTSPTSPVIIGLIFT